jgi:branched-chain amino acid transport system permease protein
MAGVDSSVHPGMMYWTTSGEVILMSILGGMGQFYGPIVGAAIMIFIEDMVGARTEYWSMVIGIVMLVMVLVLPRGIVGEIAGLKGRFWRKKTVAMEVEFGTHTRG